MLEFNIRLRPYFGFIFLMRILFKHLFVVICISNTHESRVQPQADTHIFATNVDDPHTSYLRKELHYPEAIHIRLIAEVQEDWFENGFQILCAGRRVACF
jgi:hypothetical protein